MLSECARRVTRVVSTALYLGCAPTSSTPAGSPGLKTAVGTSVPQPGPQAEMGNGDAPDGANRLPGSLGCEPEPPCSQCIAFKGQAARGVGGLDKEVIRSVITSHIERARICYNVITESNPDAVGAVRVRFAIAPSGRVKASCLVSTQLHDAYVDRCVVNLPLDWTFPEPSHGGWVVVTYPFVFMR